MVRLHNRLKQKLPLWAVWLVYLGAAATLLWLLLAGLGLWMLTYGLKPNTKRFYQSVFDNPRSEVRRLRSGGYAWLSHDVWMSFESDQVIRLKDPIGFTLMEPSQVGRLNLDEQACQQLVKSSQQPQVFYQSNPNNHASNGRLWVHDPVTRRHCYQDWSYD
jgi:hypothetical protein